MPLVAMQGQRHNQGVHKYVSLRQQRLPRGAACRLSGLIGIKDWRPRHAMVDTRKLPTGRSRMNRLGEALT